MLQLIPVLFLSVSLWLTTVSGENHILDISICPFTYYGIGYNRLFVTLDSEVSAVCFTDFYTVTTTQRCIIGPPPSETGFPSSTIRRANDDDITLFSQKLPTIADIPICFTALTIKYPTTATIYFISYTYESVVRIDSTLEVLDFNFTIDGVLQETLTLNNNASPPDLFVTLEVTACLESGTLYLPGDILSSSPEICTAKICDTFGLVDDKMCFEKERCLGNGICLFDPICTVTGPTIINFDHVLHTITDRCDYKLWEGFFNPPIELVGHFRERLRKDVVFLDSVSLIMGSDTIFLGPGGTVLLNNQLQNVNSTPQEVVGVMLSKNETGVTAKFEKFSVKVHLFFDGATAQLHLTGGLGFLFTGICSGTSVSDSRDVDNGAVCTEQYNQTVDSTINCAQMTERCNVLNDSLFTDCHNNTDPAPFITACKNTLCVYPNVNGLDCRFLAAYARACNLRSDVLDDWWKHVNCSSPRALCQDLFCGDNEFCGENAKGETTCLCRPIFAEPFQSTDSFGGPAVCRQDSSSLTLVGCLLAEKGIDYTTLHLNDANCTGQMDENKIVTFSFNSTNTCGAVVTANNSHTVYANTISGHNSSSGAVTRQDQINIEFSCFYTQPEDQTFSFRITENSIVKKITSGSWNYTLTMRAYTDAGLANTLGATDKVNLDQMIWVKLDSNGLEGGFVDLVTDSCWATSQSASDSTPKYGLITNGCSSDNTVTVKGNGEGTSSSFSFRIFQFFGNSGDVYLHCQIHLCVAQAETCVPGCSEGVRRRRSATSNYVDGAPALMTLSWTK